MTPQSGLLEGGSVLTIEGTNLGYQEGQVSVTVVDVPCHIIEYTVSVRSEIVFLMWRVDFLIALGR